LAYSTLTFKKDFLANSTQPNINGMGKKTSNSNLQKISKSGSSKEALTALFTK